MSVRLFPYFKALETNSEETNLTKTGKLTNVLSKSVDKKNIESFVKMFSKNTKGLGMYIRLGKMGPLGQSHGLL